MKDPKNHINPEHKLNELDEQLFEKAEIKFKKSAADVLADIRSGKSQTTAKAPNAKVIKLGAWRVAAAVALIVASSLLYMRVYSHTQITGQYQLVDVKLPDGSMVKMNENSELSYHPYWWYFSRKIDFEGEAFFEVEKGSKFSVVSKNGTTTVLGTSFNINSRNTNYTVYCKTGKVMVQNEQSKTVLEPHQIAETTKNGFLEKDGAEEDVVLGWTNGLLNFNNTNLTTVFDELESQYNITIEVNRKVDLYSTYSGIFTKPTNAIEALSIICLSNNLQFDQVEKDKFIISKP